MNISCKKKYTLCFRYYDIDSEDSILYSMRYKSILEYPEILIILSIHKEGFSHLIHQENLTFNKRIQND